MKGEVVCNLYKVLDDTFLILLGRSDEELLGHMLPYLFRDKILWPGIQPLRCTQEKPCRPDTPFCLISTR
jgi:hypothetical protein